MAIVTCPHCREPLDVPPELLGGPVRCDVCNRVFNPPEAGVPPDDEYDRPRRRRRPPARSGVPVWLLVILGGGFLAVCGCCGGFTLWIVGFMNPNYKPFDAPDGSFAAVFPDGPPTASKPATGRANAEVGQGFEHTRWVLGTPIETFFAYTVDLPLLDRLKPPRAVVEDLADGFKTTQGRATQMSRAARMHGGHEGTELSLHHPDGKFTVARVVVAHGKGFVFGVTGPGQPGQAPWVDEYLDGFQIKEPAAKPGPPEKPGLEKKSDPEKKPEPEPPAVKKKAEKPMPPAGPKRERAPAPRAKPTDDD